MFYIQVCLAQTVYDQKIHFEIKNVISYQLINVSFVTSTIFHYNNINNSIPINIMLILFLQLYSYNISSL